MDVRELVTSVEAMGAGEILLNCIDKDGSNSGYDLELIRDVKACIKIPVISSSGAGNPTHFEQVFEHTSTDAALGAGMVCDNPNIPALLLAEAERSSIVASTQSKRSKNTWQQKAF